ncbi:hypothetical protein F8M41_012797 [Gigaspora margarita]|uniref:Uncharacterized protein n=1 Tax=Gigaspora margarita TaxID=4874 RepID=A0A8H4B3R4_GIGMA|nr:hypothetical protein F8M41_012797 [Gigaspora margarita]
MSSKNIAEKKHDRDVDALYHSTSKRRAIDLNVIVSAEEVLSFILPLIKFSPDAPFSNSWWCIFFFTRSKAQGVKTENKKEPEKPKPYKPNLDKPTNPDINVKSERKEKPHNPNSNSNDNHNPPLPEDIHELPLEKPIKPDNPIDPFPDIFQPDPIQSDEEPDFSGSYAIIYLNMLIMFITLSFCFVFSLSQQKVIVYSFYLVFVITCIV